VNVSSAHSIVARRAIIVHRDTPGAEEGRLEQVLTFFGVPWVSQSLAELAAGQSGRVNDSHYAVLGAADTLAAGLSVPMAAATFRGAAALYAFGGEDHRSQQAALDLLLGDARWRVSAAPAVPVSVSITPALPELTGPMSGIEAAVQLTRRDAVLAPVDGPPSQDLVIMRAGEDALFLRTELEGVPLYVSASAAMVDLEEPVHGSYYDVKDHFATAVPLVMFLTKTFRDVMWRPAELGACLIIDDPLLKRRYGFCDFPELRDLMREHRFTTSIAFIPWNWRRTTARASEFFRCASDVFSVSVHGCDHVAAEFGDTSPGAIDRRARLAQARMRQHEARTKIAHEPVMVFPQGVFSAACPAVLKQNGFVAAVNTEISPVDGAEPKTLVRDVWDVAILRYGSFAIYTRRYPHHGLHNFAFDLLLGKPCFIVAHHEFFRDRGAALVTLLHKLRTLNCTLQWRSPRDVIRRAYRRRQDTDRQVRVEMYGTELLFSNPVDRSCDVLARKPEGDPSTVAEVAAGTKSLRWSSASDGLHFQFPVPAHSDALVRVEHHARAVDRPEPVSVRYELSVAARRLFSELRDEYVQKLSTRPSPPVDLSSVAPAAKGGTWRPVPR
jgi:hypothetical protein